MGLSTEEFAVLSAPANGVEIVTDPEHDCWVLKVDGVEIWADGSSEPEDICLSRDLAAFVYVIRRLAKERDEARAALSQVHPNEIVE